MTKTTADSPADKLTAEQRMFASMALTGQIAEFIRDTVPTWPTFKPITHVVDLEARERSLRWAQEVVRAAYLLGFGDQEMDTWIQQAGMVVAAARLERLPNDPPRYHDRCA